jgi:hypothetical protein
MYTPRPCLGLFVDEIPQLRLAIEFHQQVAMFHVASACRQLDDRKHAHLLPGQHGGQDRSGTHRFSFTVETKDGGGNRRIAPSARTCHCAARSGANSNVQ